jgi:hypothetical protein
MAVTMSEKDATSLEEIREEHAMMCDLFYPDPGPSRDQAVRHHAEIEQAFRDLFEEQYVLPPERQHEALERFEQRRKERLTAHIRELRERSAARQKAIAEETARRLAELASRALAYEVEE